MIIRETFDIKEIYSDMQHQFPPEELKPLDEFEGLLKKGNYRLLEALENHVRVGYALIVECNNFIWIDYIAIKKEFQCKGYGRTILQKLAEFYTDRDGCYLEVEKPDAEDVNTLRRIEFYKNLGAKKLDVEYYYPNTQGGLAMDLYFIPYAKMYPENVLSDIENVFDLIHNKNKEVLNKIRLL